MAQPGFSPFPEIRTNRLLLRRVALTDAPEILFLRSDDSVLQYIDREKAKTIEEAETFIQSIIDMHEKEEALMWVICLLEEPGKLVGTIGFWHMLKEHYRAEVGYVLHPDHWNKGIMKEAMQAVINYAFGPMQLHSIEARINPDNIASAAVLEKTGYIREAYFKEDYCFRGKFMDTAVYSLVDTKIP